MPDIKINFVSPGDVRKPKRKRLTSEQAGIHPRLEHLYPVKALMENLFGRAEFMKIKMGGSMSDWRKAGLKLLDAIDLSVKSTVEIADADWFKEIAEAIEHGKALVRDAETIDALLSYLVAALTELVFIQLGNFPLRLIWETTPLKRERWTFTGFRSVQYVQNEKQKKAQAQLNARRAKNARRAAAPD